MSPQNVKIYPSIAASNLLELGAEALRLEQAKADGIHFDVMDGHFVPLLTIGIPFIEQLKSLTSLPLDVHIMVNNPDQVIGDYIKAGATTLTFPWETAVHAHKLIETIKSQGARAGVALNPATPISALTWILGDLDQVNVMGVNPGFSRQRHIANTATRVLSLVDLCHKLGTEVEIQVDGGVNLETIAPLNEAGATNFVAGGAVFSGDTLGTLTPPDRDEVLKNRYQVKIKALKEQCHQRTPMN